MLQALLTYLLAQTAVAVEDEAARRIELVEVRSPREAAYRVAEGSQSVLAGSQIELERPIHPNELIDRVPGAWVVRGSGQEHLTAVRSPVFTGPGACGAFLVQENGISVRPPGFCNVNGLFEVNLAQAESVRVLRGPGTVVHGANALHGALQIYAPGPLDPEGRALSLETGSNDYVRASFFMANPGFSVAGNLTDSGSFRVDEAYRHALLNLGWHGTAGTTDVKTDLSLADLDQETAGFIVGKDAYRDPVLRRQNLNPEAFRKGRAMRLVSRWSRQTANGGLLEWAPYLRSSNMEFLQHFLPGTPLERNGQDSAGIQLSWSDESGLSAGADLEWAEIYLEEFQAGPVESGSAFLLETRPQGWHYDYGVDALSVAAWLQKSININNNQSVIIGLRAEYDHFEYRNHLRDGNTRDDGTECGFGGCLYTRPANRSDGYRNFAPELAWRWDADDGRRASVRVTRGFRPPQTTELYRLQSGQSIAELDSVSLDALEASYGADGPGWSFGISLYGMRKKHFIFRDADGFNVSDGRSRHVGLEFELDRDLSDTLHLGFNLSRAIHEYDFDRMAARGETILKGNRMDTAPGSLGALRLRWDPDSRRTVEVEWVYTGRYFLDAANLHEYGGHGLFNLRATHRLPGGRHELSMKLTNLLDESYAERADYAFGNYRYFPGAGRSVFLGWAWRR